MESRIPLRAINGDRRKTAKPRASMPVFSQAAPLISLTEEEGPTAMEVEVPVERTSKKVEKKKRTSIAVPTSSRLPFSIKEDKQKRKSVMPGFKPPSTSSNTGSDAGGSTVMPNFSSLASTTQVTSRGEKEGGKEKSLSARLLCAHSMSEVRKIAEALLRRNEVLEADKKARDDTEREWKQQSEERINMLENEVSSLRSQLESTQNSYATLSDEKEVEMRMMQDEKDRMEAEYARSTAEAEREMEELRVRLSKAEDLLLVHGISPDCDPALPQQAYEKSAQALKKETSALEEKVKQERQQLAALLQQFNFSE
uniref:Uncharacterized protein n=1 Tax=Palpitomonas bilix TaxID=652834 RepID=A0A7S3GAV0_9EUKA|mmetsp:Transcript_42308/g.108906  ORF Transcript_42308/g.108906 Transcript_42308/m.108906 type:complete len:312 (+) Transcript_42308:134-1069(+)